MPDIEHSLSADLAVVLKSGEDNNVRILIDGTQITAHSLILKARSPVFKAMLEAPMKEGITRDIEVKGFDKATISDLVHFMHTDRVEAAVLEDETRTLLLLQAAHQYEVKKLLAICAEMLGLSLDVKTVVQVYLAAQMMELCSLRQQCLASMVEHLADVQATEGFRLLTENEPRLMMHILETHLQRG